MPISRKRFTKKSFRKNTRKHKKRTPHRKHRKSGKQFRFIGGFDGDEEDDDHDKRGAPLKFSKNLYRVQFFSEYNKIGDKVRAHDVETQEKVHIIRFLKDEINGLKDKHIIFSGQYEDGYIDVGDNSNLRDVINKYLEKYGGIVKLPDKYSPRTVLSLEITPVN